MKFPATTEITERLIDRQYPDENALDTQRTSMFERNGWNKVLHVLIEDWQSYLEDKTGFDTALAIGARDIHRRSSCTWHTKEVRR